MLKNTLTLAFLCCLMLGCTPKSNQSSSEQEEKQPPVMVQDGKEAGERMTLTMKGVEYAFRWCPAGKFMMGSPESELGRDPSADETQHEVTLTRGFWILETPLTQEMWESVTGNNPSKFKDSKKLPVGTVSWDNCQEFTEKLNSLKVIAAGHKFSLPTEAQWEYACRAGTTTALNNGKDLTSANLACPNLDEVGWYDKNSDLTTHEVGLKKANAWGLHDMHGNVVEWCLDWYDVYPKESVTDPAVLIDPENGFPGIGSYRITRGGSGGVRPAGDCRSASRIAYPPSSNGNYNGLRLVLVREN